MEGGLKGSKTYLEGSDRNAHPDPKRIIYGGLGPQVKHLVQVLRSRFGDKRVLFGANIFGARGGHVGEEGGGKCT
jgi:hypothetical protein